MPTLFADNWYGAVYLGFYLFVPFLNLSLNYLDKKTHRKLVSIMIVLGLGFNFIWFQSLFEFSNLYYFILGFYIATYIRLYNPSFLNKNSRNLIIPIILCLLFALWSFFILKYGLCIPYIRNHIQRSQKYLFGWIDRLPVFVCSIFIFGFFKNLRLPCNGMINIIASTSFGVYLTHENILLKQIIYHRILKLDNWVHSSYLIPYMICCVIIVFVSCSIIELIRRTIIDKPVMYFLNKKIK